MRSGNEIAIVGLSCRFPAAANVDELWEILRDGRETLRAADQDVSSPAMSDQVSHTVRANCILPDLDLFDAGFFGFNPREAEMTDPQHRVFLECAWEALETAGIKAGDRARPIGVFAGTGMTSYVFGQIDHDAQILDAFPSIIATDKDFVATRVSFKLNLTGPSITVQCACSTAMVAVHLACQSLIAGECDAAIAGGIAAAVPQHDSYKYLPGAMLAPDGRCRPFDAAGRGTVFADGAAVIALMRLEDAMAGGYPIRAVILGSAVNNDGSQKPGYTAPTVDGQVQVVSQALAVAGVAASDLDFIEAHGTGTVLGDAIEIGALTQVMRAATDGVGVCALGSIKANIGHTLAAAGVAGIIKAVFAIERQAIPACPNFETPNPDLVLESSPFFVNTQLLPWDRPTNGIRRAGVSSFGVGGTNAHVVLEEAPVVHSSASRRKWQILPLSTRSEAALPVLTERMRAHLQGPSGAAFADTAFTAAVGRRAFEHRRVVIAEDAPGAAAALAAGDPARVFTRRLATRPAKVAFMFTGQGSQYPGMGADFYRDEPVYRAAVDRCLSLLEPAKADELRRLVFTPGAASEANRVSLQRTETAQLALFIVHVALAELLGAWGVRPAIMIGHSIGDYAAAHLAGVLSLEHAIALVTTRGRLMGEMEPGTMLSVVAELDELPALPADISPAAVNAPKLVVLAGPTQAVEAYEAVLAAAGFVSRRLSTSHAFHSAMMDPMLGDFERAVRSVALAAPATPFISSLTGAPVDAADAVDPSFWARQIRNPVQFARGCAALMSADVTAVVEVGPGRGLTALARQCGLAAADIECIATMPEPSEAGFHLAVALGRLWLAGVDVAWDALYEGEKRVRIPLPTTPFTRQRYWIDPALKISARESAEKRPDVREWFYAPAWKQLAPLGAEFEPVAPSHVLVVGESDGLAGHFADRLRARGHSVTVTGDSRSDALDGLVAGWNTAADAPDRIVHLTSLDGAGASTPDAFSEAAFWARQERDVLGLLRVLQAVNTAGGGKPLTVHIVSTGLFDVTGADALVPENAPLLTFARCAPQELPSVTCRVVDIDPVAAHDDPAALVDTIEARLATATATDTVMALRRRRAWRLDFEQISAGALAAAPATRERGVYLITGGLGNVGLVFARYLARTCRARLVLVGRSPLPPRERWAAVLRDPNADPGVVERIGAIRRLEELGAEVLAVAADTSNEREMANVIRTVDERFGAIDGVVHCAGVTTAASMVLETGLPEFERNFRAKVFGMIVLDKVLATRRLDFRMVVSSLSAVLGGLGHMAYAAANACADALALERNGTMPGTWTTVDWDSWRFESGRVDKVQAVLNMLDYSIDEAEGATAIELLLSMRGVEHVIVSTGALRARARLWIERYAVPFDEQAQTGQHERPDVETPYEEPVGAIEQRLAAIWAEALGIDRVGRNDDFFEIGGHSLLAVGILSKTRDAFGIDFPFERAMEAARLSSAAAVIAELLGEGSLTLEGHGGELAGEIDDADARRDAA